MSVDFFADKTYVNNRIKIVISVFWFLALTGVVSYISRFHMIAFENKPIELSSLNQHEHDSSKIKIHHFLSTTCGCSKKILDYLAQRQKSALFAEKVYLVENIDAWKEKLIKAGFEVEVLTEETAQKQYGIDSVPLLVMTQKDRKLYQGGYNEQQMHNRNYHDLEIAQGLLKQNLQIKSYPLFGCANGKLAKKAQDPLGVKYE